MESAEKKSRRWTPPAWLEGLVVLVLGPVALLVVLIYVGVAWWLALIAAAVACVYFASGPR